MNPHDELLALRHEVEALRLTNAALQQRLSADAEQTDTMLRELEAKGNELRNAGRRQLDLAAFTQRVIDAVGALVIVLDNQGAIQRINLAASIYLGIKMPLSAALTLDDWLDPRALAVLRATLGERPWEIRSVVLECAREQGQYRGEHTLRGASGSARHFLLETSLIYNRQGKEEGAVVCATNIQSLKDAEVDLRLAASVFENSRNGITITNAEAVIQRANAAFTEILGYEAEECIGQPVSLLRSDLHDQAFYERMWHSLNTLGRWQGEIIDRHKNGELVHIWQSISSVRGDDGATSHYVANFVDISAQKALERELRSAKESAEAAARAKGDFLANMSHEIRTPMNGIIGLLKLLEYTPLDPTQHDYVIKTKSAATSLLGILNDILDYSKVAAGKMQLERQPFSLGVLMQDVGIIATANLGEKILELVYNIAPEVPDQLLGDALRLKQVLTNLIGNAIKFTATGEIVVGVRCIANDERGELAGDEVALEFSVQDSGIGIPADKLATIFDSFSQADSSTTRKFGGTGLGLAISQSLVTLMGGQLAVESVYGQGSCFHFCAHLGRGLVSEPPVPPSEAEVILDPETGLPLGRQLRTLIVDDNATARTTLGQMCERFGWQVSMAAGGEEALAACAAASARGEDFQLVLMDWRMPGMDGMSATRQLRGTLAGGRRPVVILLTAFDPGQVLQADPSAKNLFDGILMKPVTESTVFDTVLHSRAGRPRRAQREETLSGRNRLAGMHVLVVDDNALNLQVAKGLLRLEGAEAECIDRGLPAVDRLLDATQAAPDVVLMDVQMPDIDGYEATRRLRTAGCTLPILAMTANVMESDVAAAAAAGMDAHVGKPIDLDDLVSKLSRWLRANADADHATAMSAAPAATPVRNEVVTDPQTAAPGVTDGDIVIDRHGALQRMGGMESILRLSIDGFVDEVRRELDRLASDLAQGSLADGRRGVHSIKGLASTVGATQLSALALTAESEWKAGIALARAHELHTQLEALYNRTLPALQAVQAGLSED